VYPQIFLVVINNVKQFIVDSDEIRELNGHISEISREIESVTAKYNALKTEDNALRHELTELKKNKV
jgi:regulator of replication initiation timing